MTTSEQGGETERCRALTNDGDRCSNAAREDGFCHLHDEDDPVAEEQTEVAVDGGPGGDSTGTDGSQGGGSGQVFEQETGGDLDAAVEEADDADGSSESSETGDAEGGSSGGKPLSTESNRDGEPDIVAVRRAILNTAETLIGRPLDGVMEVTPEDDGWRVLVEVVERAAVPDTQDILGKYEIEVTDDLDIVGYRRLERYRRTDTGEPRQ